MLRQSKMLPAAVAMGLTLAFGAAPVLSTGMVNNQSGLQPMNNSSVAPKMETAPGELLVKFRGVAIPENFPGTGQLEALRGLLSVEADQALGMLEVSEASVNSAGVVHLRFKSNLSVSEAAKLLEQTGKVAYAEPNYRVKSATGNSKQAPEPSATPTKSTPLAFKAAPNDPRFKEQWGLNNTGQTGGQADADIDALEAWDIRTDASNTIVAVLGTGIEYTHVDLAANMWKNPGEICADGIDNDANGYIDDCYGIDAYLNSGDPMDDNGWGTHMAGIVGAVGNNAKGIAGVAWKTKLMGLRFLDEDGWGWVSDAVQCLDYAIKIKTKNSYPRMVILSDKITESYSKALYDMLNKAQTAGILVVTGDRDDGNHNQDTWPYYPGSYELNNIITVAGSDAADYRPGWGWGFTSVDLAAPATDILSTWLNNTYKLGTSSSAAAAHVAGASAILWSQYPESNWKQIKGLVLNGAEEGLHNAFLDWWNGWNMTEGRFNFNTSLSGTAFNAPAVFAVNPPLTDRYEATFQPDQQITLTGINFGATKKIINLVGQNSCDYNFPLSSIVSWADEKIVAKAVPAEQGCDYGRGRLMVRTAEDKVSRGSSFRMNTSVHPDYWNLYPTYQGGTLLEHNLAAFAQVGNNMWIIGGRSNYDSLTGSVEKFSLLTLRGEVRSEWEMPMPVRNAGAAAIGNKIYVVGGYDDNTGKYRSTLQIFDTVAVDPDTKLPGVWTRGRNLPRALIEPSVVAVSGKLYVIGGRDPNNTGLKTTYVYTPSTNTWQTKANLPLKRAYAGVATPNGTKEIWLLSGYNESGGTWSLTTDVLVYTIATNTWEIRDDIALHGAHAAGGAINIGSKVFALYGDNDWGWGEWLPSLGPSEGLGWHRMIARSGNMGTYTPMLGKIGNTIYMISGSRGHEVYKFESP